MRLLRKLWAVICSMRYEKRNCANCPASHAGYESHDFDSCEIYPDFKYEDCPYIWLPRRIVKRIGQKGIEKEAAAWAAYAEQLENDSRED